MAKSIIYHLVSKSGFLYLSAAPGVRMVDRDCVPQTPSLSVLLLARAQAVAKARRQPGGTGFFFKVGRGVCVSDRHFK